MFSEEKIMPDDLKLTIDKFTFRVAIDRFYNPEGVWAKETEGVVRIGLSDFLQQRSGDIAFVDVKPPETVLAAGDEAATIETIKVNIVLSSPVAGKIVQVNPRLAAAPEIINQDPFGEGWLCEVEASDWAKDQPRLLDAAAYFEKMKREAEEEVKRK
jgi:glycine cleavage system H protein